MWFSLQETSLLFWFIVDVSSSVVVISVNQLLSQYLYELSQDLIFFSELTLIIVACQYKVRFFTFIMWKTTPNCRKYQALQTQCLEVSALALTWKLPSWEWTFTVPDVHAILPRIEITNNLICNSYKWQKLPVCFNKLTGKIAVHVPWR